MDLAHDILGLADKVVQVPGLSAACSLAMLIIRTVQISKNNTARLQYLAHTVADHLISIAEHMEGKWDGATDNLKWQLDVFDAVLQDINKLVIKYCKSSPIIAFMNAGDRDMEIQRLERRLADSRTSILVLLGVDASLALQDIHARVDRLAVLTQLQLQIANRVQVSLGSQAVRSEDTHSRVVRIEDVLRGHISDAIPQKYGDNAIPLYSQHEWRLLRTISRDVMSSRNRVVITLSEAEHRTNGQVVLLRTYEGSDSNARRRMHSRDLGCHADIWEPNILQLLGASVPTSSIPFQVYDAPSGRMEGILDWLRRTGLSDPVETICGLYDMRTSILAAQALLEFQASRHVHCVLPFGHSVVNVRITGSRVRWALIYTGDIEDGDNWSPTLHDYYRCPPPLGHTSGVINAFREGSETWAEGVQLLDALLEHGIQSMDMATLSSTLFENGWLGAIYDSLHPATVGLGDVGYTTKDRRLVVVANLHAILTSADGGALTWELKPGYWPGVSQEAIVVIKRSGKAYKRYERRDWSYYSSVLKYVNLDQRHAWNILRDHACEIIAGCPPTICPHDLRLVISIQQSCRVEPKSLPVSEDIEFNGESHSSESDTFEGRYTSAQTSSDSTYSDQPRIQGSYDAVPQPATYTGSHAATDAPERLSPISLIDPASSQCRDEHSWPLYYLFASDGLHIRDSGLPELSPSARASFRAEPAWLDDGSPFGVDDDSVIPDWKTVEKMDGWELGEERDCSIKSLQLPRGVAHPYVEKVGDEGGSDIVLV